jgi:hypothetical protein
VCFEAVAMRKPTESSPASSDDEAAGRDGASA